MSRPPVVGDLPPEVARAVGDADWTDSSGGHTRDLVYRIASPRAGTCYLKILDRTAGGFNTLVDDRDRLAWLAGRLPAPRVVAFAADARREWLLMTAVPGVGVCDRTLAARREEAVRLYAHGLRLVHGVPAAGCPFDHRAAVEMAEAKRRLDAGLVDEAEFDDVRQGRTAASLWEELVATRPASEDLVFTHGDYCEPNVLIAEGNVSGFVDLGSAGVSDRYLDVALAVRSLRHNGDEALTDLFLRQYGLDRPDPAKIAWYQLLDEFF